MYNIKTKPGDVVLIPGDIHFGICDLKVYDLMLDAAADAGVTKAVLLGDTFECGGLSKHNKEAKRQIDGSLVLHAEMRQAEAPLQSLLDLVKGEGYAMPGNHEERINRFVDENPAWYGMKWYDVFAPVMKGWKCLGSGDFFKLGALTVFHGHTLTGMKMGGGVTPARTVLNHYPGQNTIFGHTHRRDQFTRPTWKDGVKVQHGAWNVGHLQDEKFAGWSGYNAWEQSFALVTYFDGGLFDVAMAKVFRDRRNRPVVMINGKSYK